MIIVSNVTDKISSLKFQCIISYITNWYFGSDYMAINKKKSNWEQSMLYTKSLQVLHRKGISMLRDLRVSSLTCKCVIYRPELNANGGPHGVKFCKSWNEIYQWIEL